MQLPAASCCASARSRGESLQASAPARSRFLLLEVPGPWGRSALTQSRLDPDAARELAGRAESGDVRIVLIRRSGRLPSPAPDAGPGDALNWAIADTAVGLERVLWGFWREPADLLRLDLRACLPDSAGSSGPQRVALVCTNAKRDQCCAILGRPVAAALAASTDWDTWECSHLGGHRFAANILLLPSGDMFGQLGPESAIEVVDQFDQGQILLPHHRGRCGQPPEEQAALHGAAVRLADSRPGALQVRSSGPARPASGPGQPGPDAQWPATQAGGVWQIDVIHRQDRGEAAVYQVTMTASLLEPVLMSCADDMPKPGVRYDVTGFTRLS